MLTFNNLTADTFESGSQRGAGRKRPRHREAISCLQCRSRKIRCDRKLPCQQCQTRDVPLDCCYSLSLDPSTFRTQTSETLRNDIQSAGSSNSLSSRENSSPKEGSTPLKAAPSVLSERFNTSHSTRILSGVSGAGFDASGPVRQSLQPSLCTRRIMKTRLIGRTHWRVPCNDLIVLKAMLEKTDIFADCQKEFGELKLWTKAANAIPSSISMMIDARNLPSLLPNRKICEDRIAEYCQTYGHIYDFVDAKCLTDTLNTVCSSPVDTNPVDVSKVILVIAIAMQTDEAERLNGRNLARYVEACYHSSSLFQKPCIGTVQALLLLVIIKMIASSDTEKIYGMLSILGLTTQAAHSISLHRDPALFGVSSYHAEVRKRLWACFFRLNLEYCIRSGTSLALRLEDVDCPLPSDVNINTLNIFARKPNNAAVETDEVFNSDLTFGIAAAKLAKIIAPVQQAIFSTSKTISAELQKDVREAFKALKVTMPSYLQPGANTMNPIQEIQQSLITATINTVMLIISSHFVMGFPSNVSQRSDLLDIWDNAISILHLFHNLSQHTPHTRNLAYHLLWSDTCRAAFTASMVLGRLRNIESDSTISTRPHHTLSTFHELLVGYLTHLYRLWLAKSHQGSIAAKTCLLLGVIQAVTSHLLTDFNSPRVVDKLLGVGAGAAEHAIAEMKQAMQRRNYHLAFTNSSLGTSSNTSTTVSTLPTPDSTVDSATANPGIAFDEGRLADPFAQMLDAECADIMDGVDFASFAEDFALPLLSVEPPPPALNEADTFAKWVEGHGF